MPPGPEPDTPAAIDFLNWWRPEGVLTLTAILPDESTETRSWEVSDASSAWDAIATWIDRWQGRRNIYFIVNEARLIQSKPKKDDIVAIHAAFTDADPDAGAGYEASRRYLLDRLPDLAGGHLPASAVIDSGHGLNILWRLDPPMSDVAAFEAINKPFSEAMGGKGIFNVDRLLRLPGTINLVNQAKLAKGYPADPTLARLLHRNGARYTPQQVQDYVAARAPRPAVVHHVAATPPAPPQKLGRTSDAADLSLKLLALPDWLQAKVTQPTPAGQRSEAVFKVVANLVERGWTNNDIETLFGQHPGGIGEKHAGRHDLGAEIQRIRLKTHSNDHFARQSGSSGWPEPLDIVGAPELVGWPELRSDCLPPALYRYAISEGERLNADPSAIAAHMLAACAASIDDTWRVRPKQHDRWTQQARIWTCVVKDVGARGTEMIRTAFWPVRERDKAHYERWRMEHAEWAAREAARKQARKDKRTVDEEVDPAPACTRLVTQDATVEAAAAILAGAGTHGKLTLLCDELVAFLGGFSRYSANGSAARALWLESYDGGPQHIDRITRGHIYVPNWSVIVAGNIQPRRLAGMAKDLVDDGLYQRFLTVHAAPSGLGLNDDRPLATGAGSDYRSLHGVLADLRPPAGGDGQLMEAWFDEDARAVRRQFTPLIERLQVDATLPNVIRETAPKWSGLLARLSLIFHCVDIADRRTAGEQVLPHDLVQVKAASVSAAAMFLRRIALPNLFRLGFETLPEEGAPTAHARWLAGHILAHAATTITARDIGRTYRPLRGKAEEIGQAMAVLCDAGWADTAEGRHDGERWTINPGVHTRFARAAAAERDRRQRSIEIVRQQVTGL